MLGVGNLMLNSLDYALIVNSNDTILFNTRLDLRTNIPSENMPPVSEAAEYLKRNFAEEILFEIKEIIVR